MASDYNFVDDDKLTDDELIVLIREGNQSALNDLIIRYSGMVKGISRSYFSSSLTAEDWYQEGMIGLLSAIHSYFRSGNGASFASYASICVKNRLNSVWRTYNNKKNMPLNNYLLYDDASVPAVSSPEDGYIESERYRFFTDSFSQQLSETERKVFAYYLSGFSYKETADKLNLTEKSVDNALCRAKSKLKKAFGN